MLHRGLEAQLDALRRRMADAEHSFQAQQKHLMETFLSEQRRIFEDSLELTSSQAMLPREAPREKAMMASEVRAGSEPLLESLDEEKSFARTVTVSDDSNSDESDSDPDPYLTAGLASGSRSRTEEVSSTIKIKGHTRLQKFLLMITESSQFAIFSSVLVLSVCLQLGLDVHFRMSAHFDKEGSSERIAMALRIWQFLNLGLFIGEMTLRIAGERREFFCGEGRAWNLFDSVLLVFSCSTIFLANTPLSCLRVVRLFRMVRVFEVFPDLRMMFFSILACISSVFWSMILMILLMWMMGCYLMEVALMYLPQLEATPDQLGVDAIHDYWGGMFSSINSLVFTITGGLSWGDLSKPFFIMNPLIGTSYTFFVIIFLLGFWNILVGIFVQKSEDLSGWDLDGVLASALEDMENEKENLGTLFQEIDTKKKGEISVRELKEGLQRSRIRAYFRHLKIDDMDPNLFFKKLDISGDGYVDKEEFTQGCLRLQGAAKPAEVAEILSLARSIELKLGSVLSGGASDRLGAEFLKVEASRSSTPRR